MVNQCVYRVPIRRAEKELLRGQAHGVGAQHLEQGEAEGTVALAGYLVCILIGLLAVLCRREYQGPALLGCPTWIGRLRAHDLRDITGIGGKIPGLPGSGPDGFTNAASRIGDLIARTARTWAWLNLTGPASDGRFPYTLALKRMDTDEIVDTGTVKEGEKFKLVLRADQGALRQAVDKRYVYVFVLDVDGKAHLLFPAPDQGNVENQVPYDSASLAGASVSTEILLRSRSDIEIRRPLGTDTYVLLSSREAIPNPRVLDYEGSRTTRGERPETALARLLSSVGTRTRSAGLSEPEAVPVNWSIQRLTLRSVPSTAE